MTHKPIAISPTNGTWWCHYTLHGPGFTKRRVRVSLQTSDLAEARRRRDALLAPGHSSNEVLDLESFSNPTSSPELTSKVLSMRRLKHIALPLVGDGETVRINYRTFVREGEKLVSPHGTPPKTSGWASALTVLLPCFLGGSP